MPAQAQTTTNSKVRTGNIINVLFGGVKVGLVKSVEAADDYGLDPATGIGDIHVQEHVPTVARHTLAISNLVLKTGTMRQLGIIPENGDDALKGKVFDFVKVDRATGAILRTWHSASYGSGNTNVGANQIVMQSGTFLCLDVTGTGI